MLKTRNHPQKFYFTKNIYINNNYNKIINKLISCFKKDLFLKYIFLLFKETLGVFRYALRVLFSTHSDSESFLYRLPVLSRSTPGNNAINRRHICTASTGVLEVRHSQYFDHVI